MQIDDLIWRLNTANRPGRAKLIDIEERPALLLVTGTAPTTLTLTLPSPTVGFLRKWCQINLSASRSFATNENLILRRERAPGSGTFSQHWKVDFFTAIQIEVPAVCPAGGGGYNFLGANTAMQLVPYASFLAKQNDLWQVQWTTLGAASDTFTASCWYVDLPF